MKRRLIAVLCAAFLLVFVGARPASAHNAGGVAASNYKSVLTSVSPAVPGVSVSIKELGDRVEIVNKTSTDLMVLGYSGEPYLRVGIDGSYVNKKSPAYFTNQTLNGTNYVPPSADAKAVPEWHKISSGGDVNYHDHRTHWVSNITPPDVKATPNDDHLVIPTWTIAMKYGDQDVTATGHLSWIAPRSAVPWFALAAVSLIAGLAFLRWPRHIAVAILVLIAVDVVHSVGLSLFVAGTWLQRLSRAAPALLPSVIAWFVGIYGARRIAKGHDDGPWFAVFAACLIGVLGGLSDLQSLTRSQVAFIWAPWLDRAAVAVSLGLGAGLFISLLGVLRLQRKAISKVAV